VDKPEEHVNFVNEDDTWSQLMSQAEHGTHKIFALAHPLGHHGGKTNI